VEAARDENITKFTGELEKGVEDVSKEVSNLRAAAGNDMILDERAAPEAVIAFMSNLDSEAGT
jgi:dynein heavy chain